VAFELWVLAHSASSVNLFFRLMDDAQFSSLRAFVCLRGGSGKCPLCLKTALCFRGLLDALFGLGSLCHILCLR